MLQLLYQRAFCESQSANRDDVSKTGGDRKDLLNTLSSVTFQSLILVFGGSDASETYIPFTVGEYTVSSARCNRRSRNTSSYRDETESLDRSTCRV